MRELYKVPVVFFFVAACMGLFLRYIMIFPVEGITFSFVLHGHSHAMFLGWVANVLFIAYMDEFAGGKKFLVIFWTLQVLILGMLISFPLQGYGLYSIIFSTLHTFAVFVFIFRFFRSVQGGALLAVWLAKASLIFFVISSAGPFFLGYLKANGLDHSNLYRFSIYFYLHFQYNGFFFFGILSLFTRWTEHEMNADDLRMFRTACTLFVAACVPAYGLSILWAQPGLIFNVVAGLAALLQLIALVMMSIALRKWWKSYRQKLHPATSFLLRLIYGCLWLKLLLQLVSAEPSMALLANELRSVVIAYLHLMLVGVVSLFLIAWLLEKQTFAKGLSPALHIFLLGFLGSELLIGFSTWIRMRVDNIQLMIFVFSALMIVGVLLIMRCALLKKT